jgi:hemoglobin
MKAGHRSGALFLERAGSKFLLVERKFAPADNAHAQAKQTMPEKSLYERLGGVFAIAAVVDHFSDAVVKNPIVGQQSKNPQLQEWHTKNLERLPGLKFMRTLWVCNVSGGPFQFAATKPGKTPLGLEEAHREHLPRRI